VPLHQLVLWVRKVADDRCSIVVGHLARSISSLHALDRCTSRSNIYFVMYVYTRLA
jgi:hypothetical protein